MLLTILALIVAAYIAIHLGNFILEMIVLSIRYVFLKAIGRKNVDFWGTTPKKEIIPYDPGPPCKGYSLFPGDLPCAEEIARKQHAELGTKINFTPLASEHLAELRAARGVYTA